MRIYAVLLTAAAVAVSSILLFGGKPETKAVQAAVLQPLSKTTEGQLQVLDKKGQPVGQCPLKHTSVSADIAGFVARVDVTQEFTNPLDEKIEAVYVFPLPQDSAVDRMEMTVGKRTIRGEIKKREEARQIYEKAKEEGHVASLLDQERPNIFTQSVANIMPGETVLIKISYVDNLKYENGRYEFVFPMVVGPRYIPGKPTGKTGQGSAPDTDQVNDASKITPPITPEGTRAGHDISVEATIHAGVPLGEITSVLHEVDISRRSESEATVRLKDRSTIPNKDFILRYQVAGGNVEGGVLSNTRSAGDGYFSLVLVPPESPTRNQITPKEMIFVIDSSGSQQGWPINKAKETMKLCVEQMNPGDTFQMLAFSNDVVSLFEKPKPNTTENRALAQEFLQSRLGSGGTEMMKAIVAALTPPPDPDRLRIVCFMTDGYVGNDLEILDAIKRNIGNARLFSFGIGNSVNRFLLDGMADMGRGAVEYVTLAEKGQEAAQKFYNRISKPVLTDVSVNWGGLPVTDIYPEVIPDLFSSQPLILKGRYDRAAQGTIIVSGKLGGRPWNQQMDVDLPAQTDENQALPPLWARAKIADLMKQDYNGLQSGEMEPGVKDQITQVALDYQLMSQFTSFVAVEEKVVTEGGKPKTVAVPVEMPEGVSYKGIFGDQTAALGKNKMLLSMGYAGTAVRGAPMARVARPQQPLAAKPLLPASAASVWDSSASERERTPPPSLTPAERKAFYIKSKLDPMLVNLKSKLNSKGNYSVPGKIDVKNGKVRVSIRLTDLSEDNIAKLKRFGFEMAASAKSIDTAIGILPVSSLDNLAQLSFVLKVKPVME